MSGLFEAFRTDKTSIRNKASWLYYILTGITLIVGITLLFGHSYTKNKTVEANTKVGKWNELSATGAVKIDKWEWNKTKHTMDIILKYKDDVNQEKDIKRSYETIANNTPNTKSNHKVIAKTDNKQAIRIYDVNKGFEVMIVKIFEKSGSVNGKGDEVTKLMGNEKKVEITHNSKDKNKQDYQLLFIKNDIEDAQKTKENLIANKAKLNKKIDSTDDEIDKLDSEKSYQTGDEKSATNTKIESKKTDIDSYKTELSDYDNEIKEADEKVKLLKQKYKDTKTYNE